MESLLPALFDQQLSLFAFQHQASGKQKTKPRMHSSRMRTTRSSSHPGGVSNSLPPPPGPGTPPEQAPPRGQNHRRL